MVPPLPVWPCQAIERQGSGSKAPPQLGHRPWVATSCSSCAVCPLDFPLGRFRLLARWSWFELKAAYTHLLTQRKCRLLTFVDTIGYSIHAFLESRDYKAGQKAWDDSRKKKGSNLRGTRRRRLDPTDIGFQQTRMATICCFAPTTPTRDWVVSDFIRGGHRHCQQRLLLLPFLLRSATRSYL